MLKKHRLRRQVEAQRTRLYRLAWSWCRDHYLADDLTQLATAKALSRLDKLREEQRLEAWISRILVNCYRDHLRQRKNNDSYEDDYLPHSSPGPSSQAQENEIVERVRDAVSALPEDARMVVTLIDLSGLSYAEAADALQVPAGTIMSRLSRARARLKVILEKNIPEGTQSLFDNDKVVSLNEVRAGQARRGQAR